MMIDYTYPRPQCVRAGWQSLNGTWEFAAEREPGFRAPAEVPWDRRINVPFAPETAMSGIGDTGFHAVCWYRRTFAAPAMARGSRLLLHFGAVDYAATVWLNGAVVVRHEGGYTPFAVDITDYLAAHGPQTVVVRAEDDPFDLTKPRGKQDWQREPHVIWYPRTSGIWQTVWLEVVPQTAIIGLQWAPSLERYEIGIEAAISRDRREDVRLRARLSVGDRLIADDTYRVVNGEVTRRIAIADPGIDDSRNELLWRPARPTLIDAELTLLSADGATLDTVTSYTALREVGVRGDHFVLNGRPLKLRLALDQGYWAESGLTAPNADALRRDVELAKAMGFNGVRKHQKIEDPRYLYWADRLGLLVWEEMPSAYRFTRASVARVAREWMAAIERDRSHPCIVAWVPFNESWGVPDLPDIAAQRDYVRALYHLTKTLDPDRPVIGNDGWESVATDITGIHDYDDSLERIARRYAAEEVLPGFFKQQLPSGRVVSVATAPPGEHPVMLTEFGGLTFAREAGAWGYSRAASAQEFARRYRDLLATIHRLSLFAGFCYTQFADTYQETNGLLYMDRTPKFSLEEIAAATRG